MWSLFTADSESKPSPKLSPKANDRAHSNVAGTVAYCAIDRKDLVTVGDWTEPFPALRDPNGARPATGLQYSPAGIAGPVVLGRPVTRLRETLAEVDISDPTW